jgi:hypothetical protein
VLVQCREQNTEFGRQSLVDRRTLDFDHGLDTDGAQNWFDLSGSDFRKGDRQWVVRLDAH